MRKTISIFLILLLMVEAIPTTSYCSENENYAIRIITKNNPNNFKSSVIAIESYINSSMGYIYVGFNSNFGNVQIGIQSQLGALISTTTCNVNAGTVIFIDAPQESGFYTITIEANGFNGFGNFMVQ